MEKEKYKKTYEGFYKPNPINTSSKAWLKVSTPLTVDGNHLAYDAKNQPLFQITFLPLSAKKEFERNNSKLPQHLQAQIEEISDEEKQALFENVNGYENDQKGGTV